MQHLLKGNWLISCKSLDTINLHNCSFKICTNMVKESKKSFLEIRTAFFFLLTVYCYAGQIFDRFFFYRKLLLVHKVKLERYRSEYVKRKSVLYWSNCNQNDYLPKTSWIFMLSSFCLEDVFTVKIKQVAIEIWGFKWGL